MSMILCGCKNAGKEVVSIPEEDKNAKQMLQGIWLSDDDGSVVMKVQGDSIIYADTTVASVTFAIYADTLVTKGLSEARYIIIKQTANIFQFTNALGNPMKLVKSEDSEDAAAFDGKKPTPVQINQRQIIKRDSVLHCSNKQYHAYVQVNPSSYKVVVSSVNESGLQVDDVFYDNIINIALFQGGNKIYSKDIVKQDFAKLVPASFLQHAILSDITIDSIDNSGVHFLASILQPNSETSYLIQLTVSYNGKLRTSLSN